MLSIHLHKELIDRNKQNINSNYQCDWSKVKSRFKQENERHARIRRTLTMAPRNSSLTPLYSVAIDENEIKTLNQQLRAALAELDDLLQPVKPTSLYAFKRQQQKIASLIAAAEQVDSKSSNTQRKFTTEHSKDLKTTVSMKDQSVSEYLEKLIHVNDKPQLKRKKIKRRETAELSSDQSSDQALKGEVPDNFGIGLPLIDAKPVQQNPDRKPKIRRSVPGTRSLLQQVQRLEELRNNIGNTSALSKVNINENCLGVLDVSRDQSTTTLHRTFVQLERHLDNLQKRTSQSSIDITKLSSDRESTTFEKSALEEIVPDLDSSEPEEFSTLVEEAQTLLAKHSKRGQQNGTVEKRINDEQAEAVAAVVKATVERKLLKPHPLKLTTHSFLSESSNAETSGNDITSLSTGSSPLRSHTLHGNFTELSHPFPASMHQSSSSKLTRATSEQSVRDETQATNQCQRSASGLGKRRAGSTERRVSAITINKSIKPFAEQKFSENISGRRASIKSNPPPADDRIELDVRSAATSRLSSATSRSSSADYTQFLHECGCEETVRKPKLFHSCRDCFKTFSHAEWCASTSTHTPHCTICKGVISSLMIKQEEAGKDDETVSIVSTPDIISLKIENNNTQERRGSVLPLLRSARGTLGVTDRKPPNNDNNNNTDKEDNEATSRIPTIRLQHGSESSATWNESDRSVVLPNTVKPRGSPEILITEINDKLSSGAYDIAYDFSALDKVGSNSSSRQSVRSPEEKTPTADITARKVTPDPLNGQDWSSVHKNAYLAALATARSKNLPLRSEYLSNNFSRSYTFTYFNNSACSESGIGRTTAYKKGMNSDTLPGLRQVLGKQSIYDYYPNGKKNPKKLPAIGKS